MKKIAETYDVVVCGGGLAGFCGAVAAARHGARTVLIHDRPVLGGNSSSEVRVTTHGAACHHAYARETGIISELLIEERAVNHEQTGENGWINSVWDIVLYDLAQSTPNLTLKLNTAVTDVLFTDGSSGVALNETAASAPNLSAGYAHRPACNPQRRLSAVITHVAAAETTLAIHGSTFIDCTGDAVVAHLAGCEWRMGSEGREEFGEDHAPARASTDTMGNSIQFKARDIGRPAPFTAPDWAVRYDNPDFFYKQGRAPHDIRCGYWWLEIGVPWHTIHDAEDIRHELTRHVLGVWDWIKNKDPLTKDRAANYALDWIGQVPGKRESRRVMGRYLMTAHDPMQRTVFPDEIAYGGWFLDLHTPGGLLAATSEPSSAEGYSEKTDYAVKSYCGPYGIPLRALVAKDLDNLLFAGRSISVTHAALGTVRVMATTALMGQAVGTAAAMGVDTKRDVADFDATQIKKLQQTLLRDGCFLPNVRNEDAADLARGASVSASSSCKISGAEPDGSDAFSKSLTTLDYNGTPGGIARLTDRLCQWIGVASGRINRIAVCMQNRTEQEQVFSVELHRTHELWDYRTETVKKLADAQLTAPPGDCVWVEWELNLPIEFSGWLRLDLLPNPHLAWHLSGAIVPGHMMAYEMSPGRLRRFGPGKTAAFRIAPPQPCFGPEQVLSGVTRPQHASNLWRSDPAQPLPQWIELQWPQPQKISEVQLTFPGHLIREYHAYPPFYRDPQCARDYVIEAWDSTAEKWISLISISDNYQTRRRHSVETTTTHLRVVIQATNGEFSAALYEIRCY